MNGTPASKRLPPLLLSEAPRTALEFALDEGGRPPEEGSRGTLTMITTSDWG